jgi:hypothetical protein
LVFRSIAPISGSDKRTVWIYRGDRQVDLVSTGNTDVRASQHACHFGNKLPENEPWYAGTTVLRVETLWQEMGGRFADQNRGWKCVVPR